MPEESKMSDKLWVFGYGSLCWNPGFNYSKDMLGCIRGFKRRFWQGNNSHRGTEERPGRVVTLIEDENELTWGQAFQVDDEKVSRSYLDNREIELGGYTTIEVTFEPLDKNIEPFPVLIYIALESNDQYMGKASYVDMAIDIISSEGDSGHNLEYLAKLAKFMRNCLPDEEDRHLFLLEQLCIFILERSDRSQLIHFDNNSVDKQWLKEIHFQLRNNPISVRYTTILINFETLVQNERFPVLIDISKISNDQLNAIISAQQNHQAKLVSVSKNRLIAVKNRQHLKKYPMKSKIMISNSRSDGEDSNLNSSDEESTSGNTEHFNPTKSSNSISNLHNRIFVPQLNSRFQSNELQILSIV